MTALPNAMNRILQAGLPANETEIQTARLHRLLEQVLQVVRDLQADSGPDDLTEMMVDIEAREALFDETLPFLLVAANSAVCAIFSNTQPDRWQAAQRALAKNRL